MASGGVPRVSWTRALAWRMARHRLVTRAAPTDLVDVTGEICGLHAQVMSSAELSLWARLEELPAGALATALWTDRTLVKLWATRGTLYLLPASALGWWLAAFGTYTKFGNAGRDDIDTLAKAVGKAIDGRVLSRAELADEVERITGSAEYGGWVRSSWGSYLKAASFRGLLCFAPGEGTQIRFTSPASWVRGGLDRPDPADALRGVTRDFVAGYGPTTPEDLTRWWSGEPRPRNGARMLAALGDEVTEVDVDGRRSWVLARDLDGLRAADAPGVARLLPAFDPWVVGAPRVPELISATELARVFRPQGWISPVLLVDGRIAGTWKHTRAGRRLDITLTPFRTLPRFARPQLTAEAERLAAYLGGDLSLTVARGQ